MAKIVLALLALSLAGCANWPPPASEPLPVELHSNELSQWRGFLIEAESDAR